MIYVIESGQFFKIGYAKDVTKRMVSYKTHNPDVQLIRSVEGSTLEERVLHKQFGKYWHHGEWFNKYDGWLADVMAIDTEPKNIFDLKLNDAETKLMIYISRECGVHNSPRKDTKPDFMLDSRKVAKRLNCLHWAIIDAIKSLISKGVFALGEDGKYSLDVRFLPRV